MNQADKKRQLEENAAACKRQNNQGVVFYRAKGNYFYYVYRCPECSMKMSELEKIEKNWNNNLELARNNC